MNICLTIGGFSIVSYLDPVVKMSIYCKIISTISYNTSLWNIKDKRLMSELKENQLLGEMDAKLH